MADLPRYTPGSLLAGFHAPRRQWGVYVNGLTRVKAFGWHNTEAGALSAIASYFALPMGADAVNLAAVMAAHRVNIFEFDTGKIFALGADLREAMGDEVEEYREALAALLDKGECIVGGGAAPAFRVTVA